MSKKLILILSSILILILATVSIFYITNSKSTTSTTPEKTIKMGYTKTSANLNVFVAQENQYFKDRGLNVDLVEFQSSNDIINALIRGDLDSGCCAGITAVFDTYKTNPDKLKLFTISDDSKMKPWNHLIIKQNSDVQTLEDLEGKKVGVFPGSNATPIFKEYLKSKDVDVAKVELVQIPAANQLQTLESGEIEALWAYEPITSIALDKTGFRVIDQSIFAKVNPKANMAAGYISTDFIQKYPNQAKRFVEAMDQANTFMAQNPTKASSFLSKYTSIDSKLADKVQFVDFTTNAKADPESLQATADFLASIGVIKQKIQVRDLIYRP